MYARSICFTFSASIRCPSGARTPLRNPSYIFSMNNVPVNDYFLALTIPRLMRYVDWEIIIVQTVNKTTISGNDRATPEFYPPAFTFVNLEKIWVYV